MRTPDRLIPRFSIGQWTVLTKADKSRHVVQIEGYSVSVRTGVMYQVREMATKIGYPAAPKDMHVDEQFVRSEIDRVVAERRAEYCCDVVA
jgi:hypothetical protein